jgi:tRNA pseudouridine55 synthase
MDGLIVVDKPRGWTSHDAVGKMRRLANTKRIGHLGTLDPAATGVLPLLIDRATRLARFYESSEKVYEATIHFGYSTDSYDGDGKPTSEPQAVTLDRQHLESVFEAFRGKFLQTPPPVSAKKIHGTPAYKLARKNLPVELKPVEVTVRELALLDMTADTASIRVCCAAGTYLRSIAHDAGKALGCGAFLETLRRTSSGGFTIENAFTIERLEALAGEGRLREALVPAAQLLPEFPGERVDALTAGQIRQGRDFRVSPFRVRTGTRYVKAINDQGDLVAIGEARLPNLYHPVLVL